jgi:hypothetical protein
LSADIVTRGERLASDDEFASAIASPSAFADAELGSPQGAPRVYHWPMFTRTHERRSPHRLRPSRRFAWVLALALLLPFAQALAWVHTLSHHGTQRSHAVASSLDTPCAICLSAAPLHGGALPSAQPATLEPPLAEVAPSAGHCVAHRHASALAYRSRAPPLALT